MPAVSLWSREDGVLGAVAPLGLAAAAGTALVVDLDQHGPRYPGRTTLASLVSEGPTRRHLSPERRGVAVLGNGGIATADAEEVVRALVEGWPNVVLRLASSIDPPLRALKVMPLVPGGLFDEPRGPVVYQASSWRVQPPQRSIVLPRPARRTVGALLAGQTPLPRDRWVRAWRTVWNQPWT